jgi:hypothetical protein
VQVNDVVPFPYRGVKYGPWKRLKVPLRWSCRQVRFTPLRRSTVQSVDSGGSGPWRRRYVGQTDRYGQTQCTPCPWTP